VPLCNPYARDWRRTKPFITRHRRINYPLTKSRLFVYDVDSFLEQTGQTTLCQRYRSYLGNQEGLAWHRPTTIPKPPYEDICGKRFLTNCLINTCIISCIRVNAPGSKPTACQTYPRYSPRTKNLYRHLSRENLKTDVFALLKSPILHFLLFCQEKRWSLYAYPRLSKHNDITIKNRSPSTPY